MTVYGLKQQSIVTNPMLLLMNINKLNYFIGSVSDAWPANKATNSPIVVLTQQWQQMVSGYCAIIQFAMPVAYSGVLYVTVDLAFLMLHTQTLQCQINSITFPCLRVAPNLIQIASTPALLVASTNTLSICGLTANSRDLIDE